ncbi:MAG: choice-of-anchor B family protein [Flavobacteriales bacterium]|nr:choice-of-anchor B family protein [Flavobacteriales bacterium]
MNHIKLLCFALVTLIGADAFAQASLNTTQLGHLAYQEDLSEVRGAVHNGHEYALVGVHNGLSIVDVQNPASPTEVFFTQGPNSIWRDPFYYNGYAYCVTEGGGGLVIVDMSPLPGSTNLNTTTYTGSTYPWTTAHNMFIDAPNQKAYIFGSNYSEGGVIILDISNPMAPTELGIWDDYYIHDGFVRGDTLWASCLEAGTFVVDVSTPSNPVVLTSWDTPSEFGHNVWPSDDNLYCFTTDEVESGFVTAYDMSDFQDVEEADRVRHPLTENVIPHNTHFINDYLVTSHYRDGLTIHDVSDPSNMILTGYFDTSPFSGGGFNGAWGAWPFLPSGNILVSDIEEGLFIIGPTYKRAARLEGTVTESGSGALLNGVQVEIVSTSLSEFTDLFGEYATGMEAAGTYDVSFIKGGYIPQTITGVELVNGQITTLDVALVPETPFTVGGMVTEEGSGMPIEGATVQFTNEFFDLEYTSSGTGNYLDTTFFAGTYNVVISAWGYVTECASFNITGGSSSLDFDLQKGYYDDFTTDFGWTVTGSATAGVWERDVPIQTTFNAVISNPGEDVDGDCGNEAYITGNGGGSAGDDDVDDGVTILRSPIMDLTTYTNPTIVFDYWFFNAGGNSAVNDSYVVRLNDGASTTTVATLGQSQSAWSFFSFPVSEIVTPTDQMQLIIEVEDTDPGHLVEGGLDNFQVIEGTGIEDSQMAKTISLYPNPASATVNILIPMEIDNCMLNIYDARGSLVSRSSKLINGLNSVNVPKSAGVYICEIIADGERNVQRLLVR